MEKIYLKHTETSTTMFQSLDFGCISSHTHALMKVTVTLLFRESEKQSAVGVNSYDTKDVLSCRNREYTSSNVFQPLGATNKL